jgi:syntaxin 1B/2/3
VLQDSAVKVAEGHTEQVLHDTQDANVKLQKASENARRARKLKWCCFILVLIILAILATVLIIKFKPKPEAKPDTAKTDTPK